MVGWGSGQNFREGGALCLVKQKKIFGAVADFWVLAPRPSRRQAYSDRTKSRARNKPAHNIPKEIVARAIQAPPIPSLTPRIPILTIPCQPTPAACKPSSTRSPSLTSAFKKADGRAKSQSANWPSQKR